MPAADRKVVVAIDLGTTGTRAVAFSKDGKIVAKAYEEINLSFPKPGWVEQNPEDLWSTTLDALRAVSKEVGVDSIQSIGITNQRETTIVWEKGSGKPIYPAIVWQDRRTDDLCLSMQSHQGHVQDKTGLRIDPYFSATKLQWILDNVSNARSLATSGKLCFGTPDVWLLWKLTNGKVWATEPSNASRTMLFDIHHLTFDDELLRLFNIPPSLMPEVRPSDSMFGTLDPSLLGREIPIAGILGDQQAALFAHGGWNEGRVKNTYGTGLFILMSTGTSIRKTPQLLQTVAWQMKGGTHYALEGSIFMGGAALQWLRDQLKLITSYDELESAASALKDNEGVYVVSAFQGLGAPYWNSKARGLISGLTRKATRETVMRASLESMAYQTFDVLQEMEKAMGKRLSCLRVDGGGCKNNFLMQFQSDILNIPVERPHVIETTALGAATLSGVSTGFWKLEELENVFSVERRFDPKMSESVRKQNIEGWRKAVKQAVAGT